MLSCRHLVGTLNAAAQLENIFYMKHLNSFIEKQAVQFFSFLDYIVRVHPVIVYHYTITGVHRV